VSKMSEVGTEAGCSEVVGTFAIFANYSTLSLSTIYELWIVAQLELQWNGLRNRDRDEESA